MYTFTKMSKIKKMEKRKMRTEAKEETFCGKTLMSVIDYSRCINLKHLREYHIIALEKRAVAVKCDIVTSIIN